MWVLYRFVLFASQRVNLLQVSISSHVLDTFCMFLARRGLVLRFKRAGQHQDFEWRTKPLGLVFSDSMPMTVAEVHEEAEHLGVRVGDVLTAYGADGNLVAGRELLGRSLSF